MKRPALRWIIVGVVVVIVAVCGWYQVSESRKNASIDRRIRAEYLQIKPDRTVREEAELQELRRRIAVEDADSHP